ncbi:adenylate cyclase type 10-like [Lycorma delicatula]|uniref:adenylate cyclase type 10-like n=1 Tax=Lycorma delicatula TaxID=130591 RepID=UPI003F50E027
MSLLLIEKDAEDCWCQYVIWAKNPYWAPDLDENLISDEQHSTTASSGARQNAGLLEAALLSEKVYLYTINDCVYSNVQAEIFATLLPSELINQYPLEGKTRTHFVGILLFGDVSGFTALCEKYFAEGGKGGTYKLTATLNSYIGAMVDVIYSYGGDIIKFSGDAFLAVWKVKRNDYIVEVIHRAIVCAMYIQHSLGSFETDANVLLRVKLAISAGNVIFSSIGEETSKYYVIYGKAVDEVKEAQDTCVSGDVVLAPSAWGHCSHVNYLYTHKDEIHIKILRIIYNPWQTNRKLFNLPPKQIVDLEKKYRYQIQRFKQVESFTDLNSAKFETVRPEVRTAAQRQLGPFLRPYLIPPVVAQVDAEQPLDYLTEMRLVTTVFINVILDKKGSVETIIERVDEVYTQIWQVVQKQMGVVNKVCMFDKDIMFLVIFGLRGAHHEYNAMRSLKCAYKIRSIISQLPHVKGIACGVTVGMTYCGVVGHPLRQEYTVIGAPVNKAARLMMYFPNKVTCDQQTYFNSGLSPIYFTEQEQKVLKGIGKVAGIYEYSEGKRGGGNVTIYQLPPLLGRDTELQTFQRVLDGYEGYPCGVLYCGDKGVGKTRLLEEFMIMCVNKPLRIILITLQTNHSTILYYTIQQIFKFMLNFASDEDIKSRTGKIISLLAGTEYVKYVFLLTHVLNLDVNDAPPELFSRSSQEVMKLKNKTLHKLIQLVWVLS